MIIQQSKAMDSSEIDFLQVARFEMRHRVLLKNVIFNLIILKKFDVPLIYSTVNVFSGVFLTLFSVCRFD